jgi:hypothetical protein
VQGAGAATAAPAQPLPACAHLARAAAHNTQGVLLAGGAAAAAAAVGCSFLDVDTKFALSSSTGPLLRLLDAETSHRVGILAARYGLLPRDSRPDPDSLRVTLWGRTFPNPIGAAQAWWRVCAPCGVLRRPSRPWWVRS